MKKIGFLVMVVMFMGCNNSAKVESKADSLANKIETTVKKGWDSTKAGFKKAKDKIEDKLEELDKKDSAKKKQ